MRQAFFAFFVFLLLIHPALAEDSDDAVLFQVSDVAADVTADNATNARDQAIMQAQRSALDQLLTRLGADSTMEQKLDDDTVASLVQAFEVQNERLSSVRYIGTFTVRFKPASVRAFLEKRGTTFSEVRSKPAVILPVVNTGSRAILWEDTTAWRAAWENAVGKGGLVPIVVPAGDLDDIAMIGAAEAISGKEDAFLSLMNKYQADSVVVAVLDADPAKLDPKKNISVDVQQYGPDGEGSFTEHLTMSPAADAKALDAVIADAVKEVRADLDKAWRKSGQAPTGPLAHLAVMVPLTSLADWSSIKTILSGVPAVKQANVISLTRNKADVDLEYYGDISQLQSVLAQQSLWLEQSTIGSGWILREGYDNRAKPWE